MYPSTWSSLGASPNASSAGKSPARMRRDAPRNVRIVLWPPRSTSDRHRAEAASSPGAVVSSTGRTFCAASSDWYRRPTSSLPTIPTNAASHPRDRLAMPLHTFAALPPGQKEGSYESFSSAVAVGTPAPSTHSSPHAASRRWMSASESTGRQPPGSSMPHFANTRRARSGSSRRTRMSLTGSPRPTTRPGEARSRRASGAGALAVPEDTEADAPRDTGEVCDAKRCAMPPARGGDAAKRLGEDMAVRRSSNWWRAASRRVSRHWMRFRLFTSLSSLRPSPREATGDEERIRYDPPVSARACAQRRTPRSLSVRRRPRRRAWG